MWISRSNLDKSLMCLINHYYGIHISVTPYATQQLLNILYRFYLRGKSAVAPNTGVHDVMSGATRSVKGVLTDLPTPIFTNIPGEPTREALIEIHIIIRLNAASVASNLDGGLHGHLPLTLAAYDYLEQTGHEFTLAHNPGNYPPTLGIVQDHMIGT